MTANAMLGFLGTLLGGAACFCLGYHCAIKLVAAELDNTGDKPRSEATSA